MLTRRANVRNAASWTSGSEGGSWPLSDCAVASLRRPDISQYVVGKKSGCNTAAFSRSVGRPLSNLEYSSGAYEVLLAPAAQKRSLHVRRDPMFLGSSLRHDRQPHSNICSAHQGHPTDDAARPFQLRGKCNVQNALAFATGLDGEAVGPEERRPFEYRAQLTGRCLMAMHNGP